MPLHSTPSSILPLSALDHHIRSNLLLARIHIPPLPSALPLNQATTKTFKTSPSTLNTFATALLAASTVQARYIFSQLIVNGAAVGSDYNYIRKNTNPYQPSFTADVVNSANSICNVGAQSAKSQTYDVKAGDKIGFKLSFNEFIEHPGPGFIYMSKAPGGVASYDGSGDWFKAYEIGLTSGGANVDTNWGGWQKDRLEFTIPKDTPDSEYLVRVRALHSLTLIPRECKKY